MCVCVCVCVCIHLCEHRQAWHMQNYSTQEYPSEHQNYEDTMYYAHFTGRENGLQTLTQRSSRRPILRTLPPAYAPVMGSYMLMSKLPMRNTQ